MTKRKSRKQQTDEPVDRIVEIERLAALDPVDYEVKRAEAAKRLGIRASALDRVVAKQRHALGVDTGQDDDTGQGRAVKIIDVLPWPEPVDGDMIATMLAAAVKTYAVMPNVAADTIALWVLHTWVVNAFTISPRLALTSPTKGCGNCLTFVESYRTSSETHRKYFTSGTVPRDRKISANGFARRNRKIYRTRGRPSCADQ